MNFLLVMGIGGPCHIETSSVICFANQTTVFCMTGPSFIKELILRFAALVAHILTQLTHFTTLCNPLENIRKPEIF